MCSSFQRLSDSARNIPPFSALEGVMVARSVFSFLTVTLLVTTFSFFAKAQGAGSFPTSINRTGSQFRIARLKYAGGSDWYNDPSSEPNLLKFIRQNTNIDVA